MPEKQLTRAEERLVMGMFGEGPAGLFTDGTVRIEYYFGGESATLKHSNGTEATLRCSYKQAIELEKRGIVFPPNQSNSK